MRKMWIVNSVMWLIAIALCVVGVVTNTDRDVSCDDAHTYQVLAECTDTSDGGALLTDVQGEMWYVDLPLAAGDEYLLCVNDNATENVEDDIILNVWREVCG